MFKAAARLLVPGSGFGYDIPDRAWFEYARQASKYTPDIAKLEEYEYQLIFACDETQIRHVKHHLIEGGEYICPGFTQSGFNYWQPETPFLPVVPLKATSTFNITGFPPNAKIKGQLLAIRPQLFIDLDNYKENGVQFQRERVKLIVPYRMVKWLHDPSVAPLDMEPYAIEQGNPYIAEGNVPSMYTTKEKVVLIRAWMYIGVPEYWDKLITNFDYSSVSTFTANNRPWCHKYYQLRAKS